MPLLRSDIETALKPHGFLLRGAFLLDEEQDAELLRHYPSARQLLLIGNAGSAIWQPLKHFIAANPDVEHPLDRWTAETLQEIAAGFGLISLFPFGEPPWWPFQQWAQRAENVFPSPVSVLIHPEYGLWHAYRGAFLLDDPIGTSLAGTEESPCDRCRDRPCLTACPVDAFSVAGYDVGACADHVNAKEDNACRTLGCLARLACPIGVNWRYQPEHAVFHMDAFQRVHPVQDRD